MEDKTTLSEESKQAMIRLLKDEGFTVTPARRRKFYVDDDPLSEYIRIKMRRPNNFDLTVRSYHRDYLGPRTLENTMSGLGIQYGKWV